MGDLRAAIDIGRAAIDARVSDDVGALVRRVRHLVPCDAAMVHEIHPGGISRWTDPGPPPDDAGYRLVASDSMGDSVVHVSLWRTGRPFLERDHQALAVVRPFLAAAVLVVRDGSVHDRDVDPVEDLTSREAQVLSLISDGATNKEVGAQLGISSRTVQKHLEHIYGKLGTHRRTAAASWFSNRLAGH